MGSDHIRAVALVEGTAASHVGFGRVGFGLSARWGLGFGRGGVWALDAVALMTIWCVHGSQLRRAVID